MTPTESMNVVVKKYLTSHKQAFDPLLINMTAMLGIGRIFPVMVTLPSQRFTTSLMSDETLSWGVTYPTDSMLRGTIDTSERGDDPTHTSVWLRTQGTDAVQEVRIIEPTRDILSFLDLNQNLTEMLRSRFPTRIWDQPLKVFYTSVAPDPDTHWLRNTLIVEFPDNILLLHLKETITDLDNCESLH